MAALSILHYTEQSTWNNNTAKMTQTPTHREVIGGAAFAGQWCTLEDRMSSEIQKLDFMSNVLNETHPALIHDLYRLPADHNYILLGLIMMDYFTPV